MKYLNPTCFLFLFQNCNKHHLVWGVTYLFPLPFIEDLRRLTLRLWNSTQLPALLLVLFTCSSSIPTNISRSESLRPLVGIVGECWQREPSKRTSVQSNALAPFSSFLNFSFLFGVCLSYQTCVSTPAVMLLHREDKAVRWQTRAEIVLKAFRFSQPHCFCLAAVVFGPVQLPPLSHSPFIPYPDKSVWSYWSVRWKGQTRGGAEGEKF